MTTQTPTKEQVLDGVAHTLRDVRAWLKLNEGLLSGGEYHHGAKALTCGSKAIEAHDLVASVDFHLKNIEEVLP